jgi:hypothetical protein
MREPATTAAISRLKPNEFERRLARHNGHAAHPFVRALPWLAGALVGEHFLGPRYRVVFLATWAVLGVLLYLLNYFRSPPVPGTNSVFDRSINTQGHHRAPSAGRAIFLFKAELSAIATAAGTVDLQSFAEPIREGVARHHPDDGIRTIDAVLAQESTLPSQVSTELRALRARLLIASSANARFCLIDTNAWSGAIEDRLHLYLR